MYRVKRLEQEAAEKKRVEEEMAAAEEWVVACIVSEIIDKPSVPYFTNDAFLLHVCYRSNSRARRLKEEAAEAEKKRIEDEKAAAEEWATFALAQLHYFVGR